MDSYVNSWNGLGDEEGLDLTPGQKTGYYPVQIPWELEVGIVTLLEVVAEIEEGLRKWEA